MSSVSSDSASERPLHVVQIETYGRGGLAHYADNLARALAARRLRIDLITAHDDELAQRAAASGVRRWPLLAPWSARRRASTSDSAPSAVASHYASLRRKIEALADVLRTARKVLALRPDVVHLHCTNIILLAHVALLRLLGQRVITTAHVVTPHERSGHPRMERLLWRLIHRMPHRLIAHSEHDRHRLHSEFGVSGDRVRVLPHGEYGFFEQMRDEPTSRAEARRRLDLPGDPPLALFFGYLRNYKGVDVLLQAWPSVTDRLPAHLAVVGDPVQLGTAERETLEQQALSVGATTRFAYVPIEEVALWFAAADALVLPYRRVSQSGVLYLALALGVPVVATRIGAWAEMLEDDRHARLVEPGAAEPLADAIVELLQNRELAERLRAGGRQLAREHSWPAIAEQTEHWYLEANGA